MYCPKERSYKGWTWGAWVGTWVLHSLPFKDALKGTFEANTLTYFGPFASSLDRKITIKCPVFVQFKCHILKYPGKVWEYTVKWGKGSFCPIKSFEESDSIGN